MDAAAAVLLGRAPAPSVPRLRFDTGDAVQRAVSRLEDAVRGEAAFEHETVAPRPLSYKMQGVGRRAAKASVTTLGQATQPAPRPARRASAEALVEEAVVGKMTTTTSVAGAA